MDEPNYFILINVANPPDLLDDFWNLIQNYAQLETYGDQISSVLDAKMLEFSVYEDTLAVTASNLDKT